MRAGELNRRFNLMEKVVSRDGDGGLKPQWNVRRRVWGMISESESGESVERGATRAPREYAVLLRFAPDIDSTNRIELNDGRTLEILSVINPQPMNRSLELRCRECRR